MTAEDLLRAKGQQTEAALGAYLERWKAAPPRLMEAVRYSLLDGGKRLRPALVLGAAELIGGESAEALPAACAVEMIHTYSLIHDDLPCMDDDDVRRGKPSLHKAFDEATAVLAGDALQAMAFELLADAGDPGLVAELARAAGPLGMVGGQQLDLEAEGQALELDPLRDLHHMKTGALIRVSVRLGGRIAGADSGQLDALTKYGECLGLAFQIADDVLDVSGDAATLGKNPGSDAARNKSTYPSLLGLDEARRLSEQTAREAEDALGIFGPEADEFRALARYVVERDR